MSLGGETRKGFVRPSDLQWYGRIDRFPVFCKYLCSNRTVSEHRCNTSLCQLWADIAGDKFCGYGICAECRVTAEKIWNGGKYMNIGLIAHDAKKKLMQNFCIAYRGILNKHTLYATGTTGRLIEEVANLNVHKYLAGALGGAQQMCAQIENNELDLIIFLREPVSPRSHEPDVNNVVRLCDMHNIPLATNLATAELLIRALDRGDLDWREMYK